MNFSYYIAKRYITTKSSKSAINIITLIAAFGVVVSTFVLFVILSGFSGLRTFSFNLLKASDPDIQVSSTKGKYFDFTTELQKKITNQTNISAFSKVVEERVFLQYKDKKTVAQLRGVDQNYNKVIDIDSAFTVGTWLNKSYPKAIAVGEGIAYKLSIYSLDYSTPLQIMAPKSGQGFLNPNNAFNSTNAQVIGAFSGTEDFRDSYIFSEITLAQNLLDLSSDKISSIAIKLKNVEKSTSTVENLQKKLGTSYKVQTKEQLNAVYYKVINTENFIGYLIGTLITVIALFNILGSMIMIIIDKKDNLQTLLKLGANLKNIRKIFVLQGFLLTTYGMLVGLSSAIILVVAQEHLKFIMITDTIPYPVEFRFSNLIIVTLTILSFGYLASKIATSRITEDFLK